MFTSLVAAIWPGRRDKSFANHTIALSIIICACALTPVLAAYFERRMIWPYSEPQSVNEQDIADTWVKKQISEARVLGFLMLGKSRDLKSAAYKVDYYFAASPERDTLAIIGNGTIIGIKVQGIWLNSFGSDDANFYSVNQQACVEHDVTGKRKSQLVSNASFDKLYSAHQIWLNKLNVVVKPFNLGRELDDLHRALEFRIESMVRKGLARRTEANPEYRKYSFTGAFRCGLGTYFVGLFRALKAGRF
jgi:hypothetical protein